MTVTVVVPSYRRPDALRACLAALAAQSRAPDQVVVALHEDDAESREVVDGCQGRPPVEWVACHDRRMVPMMKAGVARATGDIVAFTDDDARPRREWLAGLLAPYTDPAVGGVGGRDVIRDPAMPGAPSPRVGVVQWFGRPIYNHHVGTGEAREVDVLKGVNMSLRRHLWRFGEALRGEGDQVHWELDVCLRARSEGWRLIYDPGIVVDHDVAPRVDGEARASRQPGAVTDAAHNELYAILSWSRPVRRAVALAYALLVGYRNSPGPLLIPERLIRERDPAGVARRVRAAARGRLLAIRSLRARRRRGG